MKFRDYDSRRSSLEAKLTAEHETLRGERVALERLMDTVKREWTLGPPAYLDSGAKAERGLVVVNYGGWGPQVRIGVRDPVTGDGYAREIHDQYLQLTADQWHAFADIVAAINAWKIGQRDALPPSGPWPSGA